jgi:uncharacterized protein
MLISMSNRTEIENYVYDKLKDDLFAGYDHAIRVLNFAKEIGKDKEYDDSILYVSCMFHAIVKSEIDYEIKSAEEAEKFLNEINFIPDKIPDVVHAIKAHNRKILPETIEAKLLHDANLMDYLGVVGMCRVSMASKEWFGATEMSQIAEYLAQFQNKAKDFFLTESTKLASDKLMMMNLIIKQLKRETN